MKMFVKTFVDVKGEVIRHLYVRFSSSRSPSSRQQWWANRPDSWSPRRCSRWPAPQIWGRATRRARMGQGRRSLAAQVAMAHMAVLRVIILLSINMNQLLSSGLTAVSPEINHLTMIPSFLRTSACSARVVLKGAGLDRTGSFNRIQPHYNLPGGVCWGIPVSHVHHQSSAGAAANNRWPVLFHEIIRAAEPAWWGEVPGIRLLSELAAHRTPQEIFNNQKELQRWAVGGFWEQDKGLIDWRINSQLKKSSSACLENIFSCKSFRYKLI